MATSVQKITLSSSRDIPFNKLVLSQANVRRVKAGISVDELAEDIARRGLLQGLSVRAVTQADGTDTGMFEIPAGGRRYRALEVLVKAKRLSKVAPVPCIVRETGIAEEDSLAENVQRAPLHPLDQFRAFQTLRERGETEEEIAAHFFVPVSVVKQRLKLAAVSAKLLDIYAEDGMTLDQLMAFTVSPDHERQEAVFERIEQGYDKQPYAIRRMLTEGAVRASDKRALFIGIDAYIEAGGAVMRDLFQSDEGGWLQDAALVEMMVAEKLREEADAIRAEGWKWIDVATEFGYGHNYGLRQIFGAPIDVSPQEQATRDALQAELDAIEAEHAGGDDLPEEVDARLGEIETALAALDDRPVAYDPNEVARAGAFVSIDRDGLLRIERGFVRPEDELPIEPDIDTRAGDADDYGEPSSDVSEGVVDRPEDHEAEEEDGIKPLSDRLMTELTAHRTVALRARLGDDPEIAFVAAVHALALQTFYTYALDSCVEIVVKSVGFGSQIPGLTDSPSASAIGFRHLRLRDGLPKEPGDLWAALIAMDDARRRDIFAHCVAQSINAVVEPYNRRPRAIAHSDQLGEAVALDMVAAGWVPTVDNYLGRVTKARILAAVADARGEATCERLSGLKKGEMASQAEELLANIGWLPEPLRTTAVGSEVADERLEAPLPEATVEGAGDGVAGDGDGLEPPEDAAVIEEDVYDPLHAIAAE